MTRNSLSSSRLITLALCHIVGSVCWAGNVLSLDSAFLDSSTGKEFGGSVRLTTTSDGDLLLRLQPPSEGRNYTNARIANRESIKAGHTYRVTYGMRAVPNISGQPVGQAGLEVTIGSFAGEGRIERDQIERQSVSVVGEDWEQFSFYWVAKNDYAPGELRIEFRPSYFREIIELRGLAFVDMGTDPPADARRKGYSYPGQEPDAGWRAAAEARIREHRMAPLNVSVVDEWGNPLEGAEVHIEMTNHAYLFGTCVKASRLTDAPIVVRDPDFDLDQYLADNRTYREKLKELFNFVVFENDMKWPNWAGGRADRGWTQEVTMDAVAWLQDNAFTIKSHTMLWGSWKNTPAYLKEKESDPDALRAAINRHLVDQGAAFKGHIQYADVLNEAMSHNDLIEVVGWDQVDDWFKTARSAMPEVRLVINEFDMVGNGGRAQRKDDHYALVQRLLADGAPIDVLGFQAHFWSTRLTPPDRILSIIDRFATLGLPLMVSEFDMNILDEDLQAAYTRDFLKAWFSHPATEAFIMWGFWANAHWFGEPGAMFRADWSPKPNLEAYTDLVFDEWWTRETLETDGNGRAESRVFKGDYEITVTAPGYHAAFRRPTIRDEGLELPVILYPTE
jgi:GH35 family endo-1,4-beta-xylanase